MQLGVLFGSQLMGGMGMRLAFMGASIAGSLLLNGKKKPQGKLNDVRVSSSTYGRGIPIVYGTMRVTGNMIWSTDFEEEVLYIGAKGKVKDEGKGSKLEKKGKAQKVYLYYANFAMGLCAGPVDGLLRIWADNNLIYDKLNPNNKDLKNVGFTRESEGGKNKQASGKKGGLPGLGQKFRFRFYPGDETQMPDPFMIAKQGEENVPAYRGLSYLFFQRFSLSDFGNRTPTITAELTVRRQRRPSFSIIDNMEPKNFFGGNQNGANVVTTQKALDPFQLDPVRQRFYTMAQQPSTGDIYIRAFDMQTAKETKRIPITGSSVGSRFPQTAQTKFNDLDDRQLIRMTAGTETFNTAPFGFTDFIGISALGDLVFKKPGPGVKPVYFIDPDTFQIKARWGGDNNSFNLPGGSGIQYPNKAFPLLGDGSAVTQFAPDYVTCVTGSLGDVVLLDQNYELFATVRGPEGLWTRLNQVVPGVPNTQFGMFLIYSNTLNRNFSIYAATAKGKFAVYDGENEDGEPNLIGFGLTDNRSTPLYNWPPVGGGNYTAEIEFAAYSAGAQAFVMLGSIVNHATIPTGTYAICVDPISGEEVWRERISSSISMDIDHLDFRTPHYMDGSTMSFISAQRVYTIEFLERKHSSFFIGNSIPKKTRGEYYFSDRDAIMYFTLDVDEGRWILMYPNKFVQTPVKVSDICNDVSVRAGIKQERIDTSQINATTDEEITGFMIEQPTEARSVLEDLANVFMFDAVESDNKLKFKSRGTPSVKTIAQENLGVIETDFGGENEYYTETRMQETEIPERVNVSYINPEKEYEQGTLGAKRPLRSINVQGSRETAEVTLNMAMEPPRAKTLATRILYAAWTERTSHEYILPADYMDLDPGDVITIQLDNGISFLDRITDIETGADMTLKLTTVSQYGPSYSGVSEDVDGGSGRIPIPTLNPVTRPLIFNIPYIANADALAESGEFAYYWAAGALTPGFKSAALNSRLNVIGGGGFVFEGEQRAPTAWGAVLQTVPPPPYGHELPDDETQIVLWPQYDFTDPDVIYVWENIPDEEWPSRGNIIIIGDEVILFKTAVENADGSVTISNLIRGHKGTGLASHRHVPGEVWAIHAAGSVNMALDAIENRNIESEFITVSPSRVPPTLTKQRKTLDAASRKPWQVGNVRRTLDTPGSPGSIRVDWSRATRFGGNFLNGSGVIPLNEQDERYQIYLLKAPYNPKTWNPNNASLYWYASGEFTAPAFTFSTSLTTAGLTYQSDIHVVIYQLSGTVGQGYPHGVTLPYSRFGL